MIAYTQTKKSSNMVLTFTMAHVNIFLKWLLIGIIPVVHTSEKASGSKRQKNCCTYSILKTVHGCRECRHKE